jgi:hypothetical protein
MRTSVFRNHSNKATSLRCRFGKAWIFTCVLFCVALPNVARAAIVGGGTAQFTFNNNSLLFSGGGGPFIMDRHYGTGIETVSPPQLIAGVGGDLIVVPGSGTVALNANVNGLSVFNPPPPPGGGRNRQATNLDVDFSNVLATWGASEKIGIDSILRTIVVPAFGGGIIGIGDYSLENFAGTLTLFNNLQAKSSAFTISAPVFTNLGNGFSLSGDLLVGSGLSSLTGGFVPLNENVGSFSMNVTAVPEPSSMLALSVVGAVGAISRYRHRKKQASAA